MKKGNPVRAAAIALPLALFGGDVLAQVPNADAQIAAATLAGPEDRRAGAMVYGYDAAGMFVMLRKGTNDLVCLADDPKKDGFETDCYHVSLEPYMARGRELAGQGVQDRNTPRWEEAKAGKLKMPDKPASLYILTGKSYDPATGAVVDEYRRSTLYMPYATAESTGLSNKASTVDPWIMFPGTAGAHIMITPPRKPGS
jgi:hypothetical protein